MLGAHDDSWCILPPRGCLHAVRPCGRAVSRGGTDAGCGAKDDAARCGAWSSRHSCERTVVSVQPVVRSGRPTLLVLWAVMFTFIPVLLVVLSPVMFLSSMARGRSVLSEALFLLPFLAATACAVVTGVLAHRAVTGRRAWTMALSTSGPKMLPGSVIGPGADSQYP